MDDVAAAFHDSGEGDLRQISQSCTDAGILGTQERACGWNSEVVITKDDILYVTGSNHSLDGPELTGIDLKVFRQHMYEEGPMLADRYFDPDAPEYIESATEIHEQEEIMGANPTNVALPVAGSPVLLWRALAPDHIPDSAVLHLEWKDSDTLCGICGKGQNFAFTITGGKLTNLKPTDAAPEKAPCAPVADLPWYPGRQYQAVSCAETPLPDGRRVVGTPDGMLAIVSREDVYALGAVTVNGPIHCLTTAPDGTVYGVAGDEMDIGLLFSWDAHRGLRCLGHMAQGYGASIDDVFCCAYVTTCAVSPDGKHLAIGATERLGTVVIYKL